MIALPFDFTPLTTRHLLFLFCSFLTTYVLTGLLVHQKPGFLKLKQSPIYYAGSVLIGVVVIASWWILWPSRLFIGLLISAALIAIVGRRDEATSLSPGQQFFWQVVSILIVISLGWSVRHLVHPWAGHIIDVQFGPWLLPGSLLTLLWFLLLINAVNWLDGVDGLAASVSTVAFLTLGAISLLPSTQDSKTLALALVGVGSTLGFLIWNFSPARVYLGTTGSWFLGLYLGLTAIVGGGKIVTTLLVLAVPILDAVFVVSQRLLAHQPPWQGDQERHLHHRLLAVGLRPRTISLLILAVSACLGAAAILLETWQKIWAFLLTSCMLALVVIFLTLRRALGQKKHLPFHRRS